MKAAVVRMLRHWLGGRRVKVKSGSPFDILKTDPTIGRAEALRRAMLAYLKDEEALLKLSHRWSNEAGHAEREIKRIVVT
jgi:hypothetical protein